MIAMIGVRDTLSWRGWKGTRMPTAYSTSERGQEFPLGSVSWTGTPVTTEPTAALFCFDRNLLFKPLMNNEPGLRLMLPTIVNSFKYQVMAPTGAEKVRREKRKWTQRMKKTRLAIISVRRDSVGKDINALYPKEKISTIWSFRV